MRGRSGVPTVALVLVAALGAMGLGGCGDSDRSPEEQFLGTWHYDQATGAVKCSDGNELGIPPEGNKTFALGVTKGIVDITVSPLDSVVFCNFAYDVSGAVATARADQVCALTGGDVFSVSETGSQEYQTFTLTGPGKAEELSVGTIHITLPGDLPGDPPKMTTCSYDLIGHLTKVAKD